MTVKELKAILDKIPDDWEVVVSERDRTEHAKHGERGYYRPNAQIEVGNRRMVIWAS